MVFAIRDFGKANNRRSRKKLRAGKETALDDAKYDEKEKNKRRRWDGIEAHERENARKNEGRKG